MGPKKRNNQNRSKGKENDSDDERSVKKESYLNDFDIQVDDRIKSMEKELKKILADLTRMTRTETLKISKEIRTMTVKEFLEKGGDLNILEFRDISDSIVHDVSYRSPNIEDTTAICQKQNIEPVKAATNTKSTRKVLQAKRELQESALVRNAIKNSRSKKVDISTPLIGMNKKIGKQKTLVAPMIAPKFDISKPLSNAREPKQGETLVSLAGSPVVNMQPEKPSDDSNLISLSCLPQQTVLGGRLFLDENMSPNTLMQRKEIIEEAVNAINMRLVELDSQVTASSKLLDQ